MRGGGAAVHELCGDTGAEGFGDVAVSAVLILADICEV